MSSAEPDRPRRKRWVTLVRWLVVGGIFYFIGRNLANGWEELVTAHLSFDPRWLAASVVMLGTYLVGRALIWHHLTGLLGGQIPVGKAMMAWFYSQLGKYLPGKVFLYLGRLHYYTKEGQSAGKVSLAFGLELVATFSASILTVLVSAFTVDSPRIERYRPLLLVALVSLLVVLHPTILSGLVRLVARLTRRTAFPISITYGAMLRFVGLYLANWVVFGVALFGLIRSFYPLETATVVYLAGAFSFATLVGMVAVFVPSGLGVREGILGLFLIQVMPSSVALAGTLAARVWFTVVELAGVAVIAIVTRSKPVRPEVAGALANPAEPPHTQEHLHD